MFDENEKPLDNLTADGGFCNIFRRIAFVGDSLSSGEIEILGKDDARSYFDMFEYSWGQYIARAIGAEGYSFSRGGMSAREYCEGFADSNRMWDSSKACQAYVIALGVNDISQDGNKLGSVDDVDTENCENNKKTFTGYYAKIIQRYKKMQPRAKFFLMTIPRGNGGERGEIEDMHSEILYKLADMFDNTYVMDFRKYAPEYDEDFHKKFFLNGHLSTMGYSLTAKMVMSYMDYIIRHNYEDFKDVQLIGTDIYDCSWEK